MRNADHHTATPVIAGFLEMEAEPAAHNESISMNSNHNHGSYNSNPSNYYDNIGGQRGRYRIQPSYSNQPGKHTIPFYDGSGSSPDNASITMWSNKKRHPHTKALYSIVLVISSCLFLVTEMTQLHSRFLFQETMNHNEQHVVALVADTNTTVKAAQSLHTPEESDPKQQEISTPEKSDPRQQETSTHEESDIKQQETSTPEESDLKQQETSTPAKSDLMHQELSTREESELRQQEPSTREESDLKQQEPSTPEESDLKQQEPSTSGSETKITTNPQQQQGQQRGHDATTSAIIHIGPAKTATTSIQHFFIQAHEALMADGYENYPRGQGVNLATCFFNDTSRIKDTQKFGCDSNALSYVQNIASDKQLSWILSAEKMGGVNRLNLAQFSEFLNRSHDHVTIIMFYRRFYDWVMSWYDERFKNVAFPPYKKKSAVAGTIRYIPSKVDFLKPASLDTMGQNRGALGIWKHYSKYFDNVQVVNMHDGADPVEKFMCQVLPGAHNTCQMYKKAMNSNNQTKKENVAPATLEYGNLAFAARQVGLVGVDTDLEQLTNDIQFHQEHVLNRTVYDFPLECPPVTILDRLLGYSCFNEKRLVPEFFASSLGEKALRADFRKKSQTKLCDVNLTATLQMAEWQTFFRTLSQSLATADSPRKKTVQHVDLKDS